MMRKVSCSFPVIECEWVAAHYLFICFPACRFHVFRSSRFVNGSNRSFVCGRVCGCGIAFAYCKCHASRKTKKKKKKPGSSAKDPGSKVSTKGRSLPRFIDQRICIDHARANEIVFPCLVNVAHQSS